MNYGSQRRFQTVFTHGSQQRVGKKRETNGTQLGDKNGSRYGMIHCGRHGARKNDKRESKTLFLIEPFSINSRHDDRGKPTRERRKSWAGETRYVLVLMPINAKQATWCLDAPFYHLLIRIKTISRYTQLMYMGRYFLQCTE